MARCSTPTGLPLDTWAAILGLSPFEFNQCTFPARKSAQCTDVIFQFPWQHDHLSLEEIGEAIAAAERMVADELLYWPFPHYIVGEEQSYPRPHQRQYFGYAGTARGELKTITFNWKKIISGGSFNRTSIGTIAAGSITAEDEDGDGIKETFIATITAAAIGTITDANELGLYFTEAFRHGEALDETWRIRPVKVTISGNTATFRGGRELLVNPQKKFAVAAAPFDFTLDATFVNALEVHRVFTDTTFTEAQPYQGVAMWKNDPDCTADCTYEVEPLCLGDTNRQGGQMYASFGEPSVWPFNWREPDKVNVNYVAGLPLENGQINPVMAQIITYLSVSLLANEKCGCDRSNRILAKWRAPILRFQDNNEAGAQAFTRNGTAFPMTMGGQWAWSRIGRMREVESVGI